MQYLCGLTRYFVCTEDGWTASAVSALNNLPLDPSHAEDSTGSIGPYSTAFAVGEQKNGHKWMPKIVLFSSVHNINLLVT